ncbi:MAG: aspartate--tRNA(Asn) ligase [Candidatus Thermoplasmatota archaeon]|jgi:aspartyl-tRNA synthetase|nr:aspartate--tRNA(Asn) ligase [Candidatus Thermoplasmatota archaeon]
MQRTYISGISERKDGDEVTLFGWVQEIRKLKKLSFIVLRDHTGTVQITIKPENVSGYDQITSVNRESVVSVRGNVSFNSGAKAGVEITARDVKILNTSEAPLPLAIFEGIQSDFETRLNNRSLDLREPFHNLIFRIESSLLWGIRKYMHEHDFQEVHTPKIVASATEGGANLFQVRYFEREVFLNQSPQLYKEMLMASGMDRVFEVGPAFRAEEHNTVRHLNEFTSIDIEMSFCDHNEVMKVLEESVNSGLKEVFERYGEEVRKINPALEIQKLPFPRVTYRECIRLLSDEGVEAKFGDDFSPEQLRLIGRHFPGFYFITEWPSEVRAFYTMPKPEDPEVTNSFDLQYGERELTSGAQRVHDPKMLEKRLVEKGLNPEDFNFHLNAFRYGMPPHAGWAIGLERLTMILLNLPNIREVSLFPRDRTRVVP